MVVNAVENTVARSRRRSRWMFRIVVLVCLGLGACVASWSQLGKPAPNQPASPAQGIVASPKALDFIPRPGSTVELDGTATIGPWTSRSTDLRGQVILDTDQSQLDSLFDRIEAAPNGQSSDGAVLALPVRGAPIADISVPVVSLHGDSSGMDRDLQKSLNAAQCPFIQFVFRNLRTATIQRDPRNHAAKLKLSIDGQLQMAGVGRPIQMDVIVERQTQSRFVARLRQAC